MVITPQRQLRGHMPRRPLPRTATSGEHQALLAHRLTARDRWIARMVFQYRVLTSHQIVDLAFPSIRAANHRLRELFTWRVLDRFQPFVNSGTSPMHYVLDVAGAVALAHEDGLNPKSLRYQHTTAIGIAHSLQLAHTVATNGFFASLVAHARRSNEQCALTVWWPESTCIQLFGDTVKPDAYGRWRDNHKEIEFFLEVDCSTESHTTVAAKLSRYEQLAESTGIITPLLFWFPTSGREAALRRTLYRAWSQLKQPTLVPIATSNASTTIDHIHCHPASNRWLPLGREQRRPLIDAVDMWLQQKQLAPLGTYMHTEVTDRYLTPPPPMPPNGDTLTNTEWAE